MSVREVVFLGTASQVPTRQRAHNSLMLLWDDLGILFDPGGVCGARDIAEFQHTELVIAPSIVTEGKVFQQAQHVGMGKS